MISFWGDRLLRQTWHPSLDDLILYLEGELGSQTERVGDHLKHCWSCRLETEKISRAIAEFMESRNASLEGSPRLPRRASLSFIDKLDRLEVECGQPNLFSDLIRMWSLEIAEPRVTVRVALCVGAVAMLLAVVLRLSTAPQVSANEVLSRTQQAEVRQVEQVKSPVIYEKLALSRRSGMKVDAATWEIWNDTRNKRLRQRVGGDGKGSVTPIPATHLSGVTPAVGELTEIFNHHQADLGRPLCAANYETWRAAISQVTEKVTEGRLPNGKQAAILEASGPSSSPADAAPGTLDENSLDPQQGNITKAELVVRTEDWHPVSERLWVDDRVYEIAELDYRVVPLTQVDGLVFSPPPALLPPAEATRTVPLKPLEEPARPRPDPEETEMAVRYGLHQLNADLGDPVEISRAPNGKVIVDASSVGPELQARLKEELESIPNTDLVVERPSAAVAANPSPSPTPPEPAAPSPAASLNIAPTINPNEKRLEEIFGSPQAQESFTQYVLTISGDAVAHGFAVRNLALRYAAGEETKLPAAAQTQLEEMVRNHASALFAQANRLQGVLRPLLQALSNESPGDGRDPDVEEPGINSLAGAGSCPGMGLPTANIQGSAPDHAPIPAGTKASANSSSPSLGCQWQTASAEVLSVVEKVDRLIKDLLTNTNTPLRAEVAVPQLRRALSEQQRILSQFQQGVGQPVAKPPQAPGASR